MLSVILKRLAVDWHSKVWLSVVLMLLICGPYFLLQKLKWGVPTLMLGPEFPFWPNTAWLYFALYPFILFTCWLANSPAQVRRQASILASVTVVSHLIYIVWPTSVVRPDTWPESWVYSFLRQHDGVRNACPSLHAAFIIIVVGLWFELWTEESVMKPLKWPVLILACAIMLSTLTTHQHVPVDLVVGSLFGWLGLKADLLTPNKGATL